MRFDQGRPYFVSRRSTVMAPSGAIATSHPLAAQTGLSILQKGGNAVDAAIATAAVLNVVEPGNTGISGDVFAIVYDSHQGSLEGLNASGWSPINATIELYQRLGFQQMPLDGVFSITIPGALAGWEALLDKFGTLTLKDLLEPAIKYAKKGFPVSEIMAREWTERKLLQQPGGKEYLIDGRAPKPGEIFRQTNLASTFETLVAEGPYTFYQGELAKKMVRFVRDHGGLLELEDLSEFKPEWVKPISIEYKDHTLYEMPPNCQGLCALEALKIASNYELATCGFNSDQYLHTLIQSMKIAFADGHKLITDPRFREIPVEKMISATYCQEQSKRITKKNNLSLSKRLQDTDTVYLTIIDKDRNMISFINSLYYSFGSGMVVEGTGIILQNRGSAFTLDENHNNCLEPRKRPYHTIIPAMMFKDREPFMSFGVIGGHVQPQGHLQVVSNIVNFSMNPQDALDAPRFVIMGEENIRLEDGFAEDVVKALHQRGHQIDVIPRRLWGNLTSESAQFGGGQIIIIDHDQDCLFAGSDPRKDGCAIGY